MNEVAKTDEPETVNASTALIQVIERAASDSSVDIDKMERLLEMQERIMDREAKASYARAMTEAQKEIEAISQDADNDQTKSSYATLTTIDKALRPIYTKHGFSVEFDSKPSERETEVIVIAYVTHRDGHKETRKLPMPCDGKGAKGGDVMTKTHATMSAITYGRRGLLKMIFNIAEIDDDGNKAGQGETITEEQEGIISAKISEVGADRDAFLEYLGVETLMDLSANKFGGAMKALTAKQRAAK